MVKKHIIALVAVLALLVLALPLQAMAADVDVPSITIHENTSTGVIEKGGSGRVSLSIGPSRRSEERCAVVFVNSNGQTVSEYTIALENTTRNQRHITVTIDAAGLNLAIGKHKVRFWIESKNQATNRWELGEEIEEFQFEVVKNRCGSNHSLKKVDEIKATCSQIGIVRYECSVCDHVVLEETPMTDHKYELVEIYAAPNEERGSVGEGEYACSTCTSYPVASKIDVIPLSTIPKITSHPKSVSVLGGKSARFTVVATGLDLTYQWQTKHIDDDDDAWTDLDDCEGKAYYTVTCNEENHEYQFRCVVSSEWEELNGTKYSNAATLRMSDLFAITTQPQDASAYEGQKATTRVKATGLELKYAWYVKDVEDDDFWKSTITSSSYSVTMNAARNGRQVYCVVTDKYGNTLTSETATLTTKFAVKITKQPEDVLAYEDDTVIFSVIATGDEYDEEGNYKPLKYQWYYRNKGTSTWKESECTDAVYATTLTAERDGREVYCKITDAYGNTVSSRIAEMEIVEVAITKQPKSVAAYAGDMATFTVEAIGVDLEYQWYYKNSNGSSWTKAASTEDTYTTNMTTARNGRQVRCVIKDKYGHTATTDTVFMTLKETLAIVSVSGTDKAYEGKKISITVKATGDGLKYAWYFQDPGASGFTKSTTTSSTYTLTMNEARDGRLLYCRVTDTYGGYVDTSVFTLDTVYKPAITVQPTNKTAEAGETVTFSVEATGEGELKYQWYYRNAGKSTWTKAGSTEADYTTEMTEKRQGRQVYCVVTDEYGNKVSSKTATMMLPPPEITAQPSDVTVADGEKATFSIEAEGVGLKYQWYYRNAGSSSWKTGSSTTDKYTVEMTEARDGRQICCVVTDKYGSWVRSEAAKMILKESSEPDEPDEPDEPENPIEITSEPGNVTAAAGESATVSVSANGEGLTYQWYYRNAGSSEWKKASSTGSSYTFDVTAARDGRQIRCKITDANGNSLYTRTAKLTVE